MRINFCPPTQSPVQLRDIQENKFFRASSPLTGDGLFMRLGLSIWRFVSGAAWDCTEHCKSNSAAVTLYDVRYQDVELTCASTSPH